MHHGESTQWMYILLGGEGMRPMSPGLGTWWEPCPARAAVGHTVPEQSKPWLGAFTESFQSNSAIRRAARAAPPGSTAR